MSRGVLSYSAVVQRFIVSVGVVVMVSQAAFAAELPPHDPLRILIVSDYVNPHGLPPEDLTEPGDLSATLGQHGTGLKISHTPNSILEIPTNSIELATQALSVSLCDPDAYDVLIYFAHRIPNNGSAANNIARQEAFTEAVENYLVAGGGMISFHHGSYITSGKQSIQSVIGASAYGSVPWNIVDGQNVINVSPLHFITSNSIEYTAQVNYSDLDRGVPAGTYRSFNNTPDERYLNFEINDDVSEFEVLFGSNYSQNGSTHLLGFTHKRPEWKGIVFGYQPGEYQPNALDDLEGNNFQILANAIYYVSSFAEPSADLNGDGTVNMDDLLIMLSAWGDCPDRNECCPADLDEDGAVGTSDILILFEQWG
ncbi:MAG: hypothetical protein IH984_05285 [Planctomycetes bacterium]|nr:hypothetical protein [Planctomycetota bacterium]